MGRQAKLHRCDVTMRAANFGGQRYTVCLSAPGPVTEGAWKRLARMENGCAVIGEQRHRLRDCFFLDLNYP